MNEKGNKIIISPLIVWIHVIEAAVLAVAIIVASIAGYYIADFFFPKEASKGSYGGGYSKPSFADEFSYAKLLNLGILRGNYGFHYIYSSGYIPEYSYALANAAEYYFLLSDSVVKYFGTPAGTYGDAGNVRRVTLFKDDNGSDFTSHTDSTPGWYLNVTESSYIGRGGGVIIIYPPNGGGSDSGPSPTPIPAALPLFGSGLVVLFVLRRASKM